ncbi:nuclease-related domain-containing protein [Bacillaceae bacterium CLA-AA-H227]|uniref:Nuclease-related domain-containing protein n=1 Tax=Robertmurraya yapensis (ex Hitch et al 2024) TaxID=3133160 RepID=A0ACC6SI51_9BACI
MVLKELQYPFRMKQNEVLLRRLLKDHIKRKEIEEDQAKRKAGYKGEQNLSYYLNFLPEEYDVIRDIRLVNEHGHGFQMDTLLLCPRYILISDVKNILGTLYFDKESEQFIRTINEKEEGFSNPINQVERHHIQLKNWLQKNKLPLLPIEHRVIISYPSSIIRSNNPQIYQKVFHAEHLPNKIITIEKLYNDPIDQKEYRKLTRTLLKHDTPLKLDILQHYGIDPKEIITGVQCPACEFIHMNYRHGIWKCPSCQETLNNAHHKAIEDYFTIMGQTITNEQCREFLRIESRNVARSLLLGMKLKQSGTTKNKTYHL